MLTAEIKGKNLVITLPTTTPTLSSTGKSYGIASTKGFTQTDVMIDGKPVSINVNAIISAK